MQARVVREPPEELGDGGIVARLHDVGELAEAVGGLRLELDRIGEKFFDRLHGCPPMLDPGAAPALAPMLGLRRRLAGRAGGRRASVGGRPFLAGDPGLEHLHVLGLLLDELLAPPRRPPGFLVGARPRQ